MLNITMSNWYVVMWITYIAHATLAQIRIPKQTGTQTTDAQYKDFIGATNLYRVQCKNMFNKTKIF